MRDVDEECVPGWVEDRLRRWGKWASGGVSGGLGYPRQSVTEQFRVDRDRRPRDPDVDLEAVATDRVIRRLPFRARRILVAQYCRPGTVISKARELGIPRQTFYLELDVLLPVVWVLFVEDQQQARSH